MADDTRLDELVRRLDDVEGRLAKHGLQHELSGGDEVRYASQNSGTRLTRHRELNFSTGLSAVADLTNQRVTVTVALTLAAGIYTPTLTNVTNVFASTAYQCQYLRVGAVVLVSGKLDIDPTTTLTSTKLGISLPVASNLGAAEDCGGVAFASAIANQGAAILGDAANDRAQLEYIAADVTNQPMYFSFTYRVI